MAFSEWPHNDKLVGLDIDNSIFFSHTEICFFQLKQRSSADWEASVSLTNGTGFDLIIDDGLRSSEASLLTMAYVRDLLNDGGALVVEDV